MNGTHLEDEVEEPTELTPRDYQVRLYQEAVKNNCIIFLGTGTGKTFISIMLMKDPKFSHQVLKAPPSGKRKHIVFLVPTQTLVFQQVSRKVYNEHSNHCLIFIWVGNDCLFFRLEPFGDSPTITKSVHIVAVPQRTMWTSIIGIDPCGRRSLRKTTFW